MESLFEYSPYHTFEASTIVLGPTIEIASCFPDFLIYCNFALNIITSARISRTG